MPTYAQTALFDVEKKVDEQIGMIYLSYERRKILSIDQSIKKMIMKNPFDLKSIPFSLTSLRLEKKPKLLLSTSYF